MSPPRPSRGLPTSRAYWELKAEQMMNRVFAPDAAIDLDSPPADPEPSATLPTSHRPLPPLPPPRAQAAVAPAPPAPGAQPLRAGGSDLKVLLLATLGGVGLVAALGAVLLVQQWTGLQRSLSQERSLLLVERLRSLGPANAESASPQVNATPPAPVLDPAPAPAAASRNVAFDGLPPPPPEEPWMQQLSSLPPSNEGRAPLLRVPLSPRLAAVAPAATGVSPPPSAPRRDRPSGPLPQLVGLVGAPGRSGSAIFQVGDASINVNVGESIGGSGWRLRAADAESALIERGSEVRRIAIVTGG